MAATTITLDVLKGSIPAACFGASKDVVAAIVMVDGVTSLSLTITSIVEGDDDVDSVVFSYDDDVIPSGVELTNCNFASFQCVCDSCEDRRCSEVITPDSDIVLGEYLVGFIPGNFIVDQIRFYSPSPNTSLPVSVSVTLNDATVIAGVEITDSGFVADRTNFQPSFSDGLFPEDSKVSVVVLDAPSGDDAWQGLQVCFIGKWVTV